MKKRTSLDNQISAVNLVANHTQGDALQDALKTLCLVKKAADAAQQEDPDIERLTQILEDLLVG